MLCIKMYNECLSIAHNKLYISKEIERDVKFWFEAEAKTLRPRPECLKAEARAEAKFVASRPVWPQALTSLSRVRQ